MKKFFRYLICTALVASPMAICAIDHSMDDDMMENKMYVGGALSGNYARQTKANINTKKENIGKTGSDIESFSDDLQNKATIGIKGILGYKINWCDVELDLAYTKIHASLLNDSDEKKFFTMPTLDMFINAIMNFETGSNFRPILGAGIGLSAQYVSFEDYGYGSTDQTFGGQPGVWKTTFKKDGVGEELKSDWKLPVAWQVIIGGEVDIIDEQIAFFGRLSASAPFTKAKFPSSINEDIYVQYKPWKVIGALGLKINF